MRGKFAFNIFTPLGQAKTFSGKIIVKSDGIKVVFSGDSVEVEMKERDLAGKMFVHQRESRGADDGAGRDDRSHAADECGLTNAEIPEKCYKTGSVAILQDLFGQQGADLFGFFRCGGMINGITRAPALI